MLQPLKQAAHSCCCLPCAAGRSGALTLLCWCSVPGKPWVLIGAVSAAGAAALVLVLMMAGYWRWRARKAALGSAVRRGGWGACFFHVFLSAPTDSMSNMPEEEASRRLALRASEVSFPLNASGKPRKLGEGAHGLVQPSQASVLETGRGSRLSRILGQIVCVMHAPGPAAISGRHSRDVSRRLWNMVQGTHGQVQ